MFIGLPIWTNLRQQIVVHEMPTAKVIKHTLIQPPIDHVVIDTIDYRAYDIQVSIMVDNGKYSRIARGFVRFVAAKTLALNKIRRIRIIPLAVTQSAICCTIHWYNENLFGNLKIRLWSNGQCTLAAAKPNMQKFEIRTVPGRRYFFELRLFDPRNNKLLAAGDIWFKASKLTGNIFDSVIHFDF